MLTSVVRGALRHPWLVTIAAILLLAYGIVILRQARFDVFPEFVPSQAEIQTEAPGLAAEQVEQLVTRPIEQAVNGATGVAAVRSESMQGLSIVTVVFNRGNDPFRARQIVAESLGEAASSLPAGVQAPKVAPLTSSTMDLIKIGFTSDRLDPAALRDLVQWTVRPRLLSVPGVARATVYGGTVRRIEVRVRPAELASRGMSIADVSTAVQQATGVTGGGFIDTPQQRILVEPRGQVRNAADVAAAQIPNPSGASVRIGDVADVVEGAAPNNGDALIMGRPGVLISLSSQYGANTLDSTLAVESALAELKPALAAQGVTMNANLHRPANFIEAALKGIADDLLIGAALIAVVLFLFMRSARAVLISFISIPLSLLSAIIVMDRLGWTINTMTLGGLAVALGVVVDDAIIDVENIIRRLRLAPDDRSPAATILAASLEVRAPVIYATLVVALVLLPVLLLQGLQGAFFAPLAAAFILATLASLAVALVVTPALSLLLLRPARIHEEPAPIRRAKDIGGKFVRRISERPRAVLAVSIAAAIGAAGASFLFTPELLPAFKEGHFVLGVAAQPGTSLGVMRQYGRNITHELLTIPDIQSVEQQIGRAEGGEDTWGTERSEFHVELKPGLSGSRQDAAQDRIRRVLDRYPGLQTEVLTFLGDRIGESLSGETAALAVSAYGSDAATLDRVAAQIARVMNTVPGAIDVAVQTPPATPVVRVDIDLQRVADRGLSPVEVLSTVQAAYQGSAIAQIHEQDRSIDIAVIAPPELRQMPEAIGNLLIQGASGSAVPLGEVAHVYLTDGRTIIAHEGGRARQVVTTNPPPADAVRVTAAVRQAIERDVKLPPGVYLDYSGTAAGATKARDELLFNSAVAGIAVIALLMIAFTNVRSTMLILAAAPFALIGGVVAVLMTGGLLSLGSLVGFVTLFGVSARNAILLVSHTEDLTNDEKRGWSLDTVMLATRERMTPILMTAIVTGLGLLPLALEAGQAGREIQGPMAIVILGGLISSTLTSLVILPALIWRYWKPVDA